MEKIIILDNDSGEVYVFPFDTDKYSNDNIEDYFIMLKEKYEYEFSETYCQWMIRKEIPIIIV